MKTSKYFITNSANFEYYLRGEGSIYLGIDSTSSSLHLGHLLIILNSFRLLGTSYQLILLLGTFTAKIGDPSDKIIEREEKNFEVIKRNREKIEKQIRK